MIMAEKDERSIASSLPLSEASTPPKLSSLLFENHKTHNNEWRGETLGEKGPVSTRPEIAVTGIW
jgi:hypothetical protein